MEAGRSAAHLLTTLRRLVRPAAGGHGTLSASWGDHAPGRRVDARGRVACISHQAAVGSERALVRQLSALDRRRFSPFVVLPSEGPLRSELEAIGVPVHVLPLAWWIPATHWSAAAFQEQLEGLPERAAALGALLRREGADLVHTNALVTLEGALAAAELGLPHVWHSRGLFDRGFPPSYLDDIGFFYGAVDSLSDAIVCVSRAVERQAAKHCRIALRRVVYDGFDIGALGASPCSPPDGARSHWGIGEGAQVLVCMGGIQRRKGQLDLVEAAALLADDFPHLVVVLAGEVSDGEYAAAIDNRSAALGLAARVRRIGFEPDVRGLLSVSAALVQPSHSEGFGLAILEAMSAGVPVVATRCGGPEEIIEDGVSGLLTPVADSAALAAALRRLLADEGERRAIGAAGRARAQTFALATTGSAIGTLYDELLAAAPQRGRRWLRRRASARVAAKVLTRARSAARTTGEPAPARARKAPSESRRS